MKALNTNKASVLVKLNLSNENQFEYVLSQK